LQIGKRIIIYSTNDQTFIRFKWITIHIFYVFFVFGDLIGIIKPPLHRDTQRTISRAIRRRRLGGTERASCSQINISTLLSKLSYAWI